MSRRTHLQRYPRWSPKSVHGPMPRWLKRYGHVLVRRALRQSLVTQELTVTEARALYRWYKGRVHWMWY